MESDSPRPQSNEAVKRAFALSLRKAMSTAGLRPSDIARRLNERFPGQRVSPSDVENWRREVGATFPPLWLLADLLEVVSVTPADLDDPPKVGAVIEALALIGSAPRRRELVEAALAAQRLQQRIAEQQELAAQFGREFGAASVLQAAARTGRWAVGVWPAWEGPIGYEMHVADRLDLRFLGPGRRPRNARGWRDKVWSDPALRSALRATYAVEGSRTPRWESEVRRTGRADGAQTSARWSILHLGSPSSALVHHTHRGAPTIAVSATTRDSWVNDIAALLAIVLGYGLTTTRSLAMELTGRAPSDVTDRDRLDVHQSLLERPPSRRVWSHHGITAGASPFATPIGGASAAVVHVRLIETDGFLRKAAAERGWNEREVAELAEDRDRAAKELVDRLGSDKFIAIPVAESGTVSKRWEQVLESVKTVVDSLHASGRVTASLEGAHRTAIERYPQIAPAALAWLADHDCDWVSSELELPRKEVSDPAGVNE